MIPLKKIAFLDRDGTLIAEPPDEQIDSLDKLMLVDEVVPALRALRDDGYRFVMVTNQDGLGSEPYPDHAFDEVQGKMLALLASQGITFESIRIDRSTASAPSPARKPAVGLVLDYLADPSLDRRRSVVVGDRATDLELAANMGLRGFRVGPGGRSWPDIVREIMAGQRRAAVVRSTAETAVEVRLDLDEEAPIVVDTGIPFFDHMLDQVARHGGFSLRLTCRGDLNVDEHHTVEDTALALGAALRDALGERRGIERYGFVLPMDEARATVSIDLGGRAWSRFEGAFGREYVGAMPTEMVPHFFASLADALRATIHVSVDGENTHHEVEACFKGLGRALRMALVRTGHSIPSTKGVLV